MPWICPEILQLLYEKKFDTGFPKLDNNPKTLYDITKNELWTWKNLFLNINNKNKFLWATLEERLDFLYCSTENITKSSSYEKAGKEHESKKMQKNITEVCQAINL